MICGGVTDFLALGFTAQSIIAPLGAFSLVLNALLSPIFIGEHLTWTDMLATFIISGGCTMATVFGTHESTDLTVDEIKKRYTDKSVMIYFGIVAASSFFFYLIIKHLEKPGRKVFDAMKAPDRESGLKLARSLTINEVMQWAESQHELAGEVIDKLKRTNVDGRRLMGLTINTMKTELEIESESARRKLCLLKDLLPQQLAANGHNKAELFDSTEWENEATPKAKAATRTRRGSSHAGHPPEMPGGSMRNRESVISATYGGRHSIHNTPVLNPATNREYPWMVAAAVVQTPVLRPAMDPGEEAQILGPESMRKFSFASPRLPATYVSRRTSRVSLFPPNTPKDSFNTVHSGVTRGSIDSLQAVEATRTESDVLMQLINPRKVALHAFAYSYVGGTLGAQSILFGKSVVEMIIPCFKGDLSSLESPAFYLVLVAMICTLLMQLAFLNGALQFHPALLVVPIYQTFWIVVSIIGAGVFFGDFDSLDEQGCLLFGCGVLVTLVGVFVLTACSPTEDELEDGSEQLLKREDSRADTLDTVSPFSSLSRDQSYRVAAAFGPGIPEDGGSMDSPGRQAGYVPV